MFVKYYLGVVVYNWAVHQTLLRSLIMIVILVRPATCCTGLVKVASWCQYSIGITKHLLRRFL